MRTLIGAMTLALMLSVCAPAARAFQCPVLIKQGMDAAASMSQNDKKVKDAKAKLEKASALHKEGKHADAVREANEALGFLGMTK